MSMRPFLDPIDDQDAGNAIAESVEAITTQPIPAYQQRTAGRVFLDLSDILSALMPEQPDIAYELVIRWKVKAEDVSEVDEAQVIRELYNWGDVDIVSIEEINV